MLGGLDPIIIFQFYKNVDSTFVGPPQPNLLQRIPVLSKIPELVDAPPIPIYLSEKLTGIYIDSEDKTVDIGTDTESLAFGGNDIVQKGVASTISINMVARKDSIGLTLLSALVDYLFDKTTSKEYAISYLHGPITIFRGVLHSFHANQNSSNDLLNIKIELSKGNKSPVKAPGVPSVPGSTGEIPVGAG